MKSTYLTLAIVAIVASFASSIFAVDKRTDLLKVDAKNFSRPTIIDNKYMPLKPGTQTVYEGWTIDDEDKAVSHKVIQIVTDLVNQGGLFRLGGGKHGLGYGCGRRRHFR